MPFQRGPYGEIQLNLHQINTPFEQTAAIEQAINIASLTNRSLSGGQKFYEEQSLLYRYFQNLLRLLSGEVATNPDAIDFFLAVMRGEAVSLCPAEVNGLAIKSFVPVLQRTGDTEWQVGIIGCGHHATLMGDVVFVLQNAWLLLNEWLATEAIHNG